MDIPFNKPYTTGKEAEYLTLATESGHISGNGAYTQKCHDFFQKRYKFHNNLLTTSCTDALEMAAILSNTQPGDEVICPSFAFVSTANAFVLRGAKVVFADSMPGNPNIDASTIESLITDRTKVVVIIHYGGVACEMSSILKLIEKYNLILIEDAAQSIDSFYKGKPLGTFGHFATFSFHETKNIISGEGGLLVVNDKSYVDRAEIIWEKGTNRAAFFRGEIDKYGWVDVGSSFLPSELTASFLYAQLEALDEIQNIRYRIWNNYFEKLSVLQNEGNIQLPLIPEYASNNAHMFYLLCHERDRLIAHLRKRGIHAVFHYLPLHNSPYYKDKHDGRILGNSVRFSETLLRLPFYNDLRLEEQEYIIKSLLEFYR
jgi:dTDP-4-amino-4,6-dideoxygalactose transaminase